MEGYRQFRAWLLVSALVFFAVFFACAQDRASLIEVCNGYKQQNRSIVIGVLDKGETGFPMSAWGGNQLFDLKHS